MIVVLNNERAFDARLVNDRYMFNVHYNEFKLLTCLCCCYGWFMSQVQQGGVYIRLELDCHSFYTLAELRVTDSDHK